MHICSQIGSRWIVTAAHCVFSRDDEVTEFGKFWLILELWANINNAWRILRPMRFCLQAPYLSSSDSSIGGKMSRLGGWWLLTDLLFDHLKTGNISGSARLLSTRTFQRIQVTSHCWNSVRNIPLKSFRDQIYCCLSLNNWINAIAEERLDLSKYPPACLPQKEEDFVVGTIAFVYGG